VKRSTLITMAKLLFAAALIWWVLDNVGFQNVVDRLQNIRFEVWLLGLVVIFLGNCLSMWRWHLLMRSVGLDSTLWNALRLGFIGVFFNNVVPGLTGGDLVKAFYITREHPNQRADAVISVIVDRVIGIVALALIAAAIIPFDLDRYGQVAIGIYGFLAVTGLGAAVVLSRRIKARIKRLSEALGRKPKEEGTTLLGKLDRAVSMYRERMGTVVLAMVMSIAVHMLLITGLWIFGMALTQEATVGGMVDLAAAQFRPLGELGLDVYCSIVPIIMIISSVPIAPAGWGVGEAAFQHFFSTVDVAEADAVALSFTYRLTATLISLLGGLFLVVDRKQVMKDLPRSDSDDPDPEEASTPSS
jgi:uncharacterized protein (TIRG00374 family)